MMKLKLRPTKPDLIVRDPVTLEPLPNAGKSIELTTYWRRRLRDGDVEHVASAKKAAKSADTDSKKET